MARLYDRRASVTVGTLRVVNDSPADPRNLRNSFGSRVPGLRIGFRVEKSIESKNNKAEAEVHNLNETSRGRITGQQRQQFIIEAGYRDTLATIFSGTAVEVTTTKAVPGILTTIRAQDGFVAGRRRISKTLGPGSTVGEAIESIAGSLGINAKKAIDRARAGDFTGGVKQFFQGVSLSGNAKDEMDKLARTYGFDWSIQDGELQILNEDETTTESAVKLSPATGLIGSPVRVLDDQRPGRNIQRCVSLMNPKIKIGRRLELESDEVSGSFRVLKFTHTGDTGGGDFRTEVEAIEIG